MESYIVDAFLCNFRVRGVKFMGLLMEKETNKSSFSRVVGCLETAIRDGVWLWIGEYEPLTFSYYFLCWVTSFSKVS